MAAGRDPQQRGHGHRTPGRLPESITWITCAHEVDSVGGARRMAAVFSAA